MSYANQLDAIFLDRHRIRDLLIALTRSRVFLRSDGRAYDEQLQWLMSLTDAQSDIERRFLQTLAEGGYRLPDDAQRKIETLNCVADFFYQPNICVFCDGSAHDSPQQIERDTRQRAELADHGFRVILIRYDQNLRDPILAFPEVFGG